MKIAVLASGGVDSSVALKLLKEEGHDLTAFYLKIWLEDDLQFLGNCPWEDDLQYVREICEREGIPLEVISMQKEYWDEVVSYALKEIKAGRTPNSDLFCNSKVKFGKFFDKIDPSFDLVATGHYADKETIGETAYLKKAKDSFKDQTYFLAHLSQAQLQRAHFPLASFTKQEVRELAHRYDLPNQARKDSQGICFLGKIKYPEFVKHHFGERPGDLINADTGEKIGEHKGYWFYTVGQRKGIELSHGPWFVVRKDPKNNLIYISNNYHAEDKMRDEFTVDDLHWIVEKPQTNELQVKVRHGEVFYNAHVTPDGEKLHVTIDRSDQGLAAGQFAVFYDGDYCLGCGVIQENKSL